MSQPNDRGKLHTILHHPIYVRPFLRRLLHTPLRDLARGRISGRLNYKAIIANATDLPQPIRDLVLHITRRTRLWRREKADVAMELLAHFTDGIAAEETPDNLINSFGDPIAAAKLIRRAKIRNRPLAWHALKWATRGFAALLLFYAGAAVVYFVGRPTPNVDYIAQMNARIADVPMEDRGWPLLVPVIKKLEANRDSRDDAGGLLAQKWDKMLDARPDSPAWSDMTQWLDQNASEVETIRQAMDKPVLGFLIGRHGSGTDLNNPYASARDEHRELLVETLLPHLNTARTFARILAADARYAVVLQDGERVLRNLISIQNQAHQLHRDPAQFLVCDLVAIGIRNLALQEVDAILATSPQTFTDDQLTRLAHAFMSPSLASELIHLDGERAFMYDILQNLFTDNGKGDGRLTYSGMQQYRRILTIVGSSKTESAFDDTGNVVLGPAQMLIVASRRELVEKYNEHMNRMQMDLERPLRDVDLENVHARMNALRNSPTERIRYMLLLSIVSSLNRIQITAERCIGHYEGISIAIALELFHRKHSRYPAPLTELSPRFLPSLPVDRITGNSLRYSVIDGKPYIYSVGHDEDDDGGRPATAKRSRLTLSYIAAAWGETDSVLDGDWILFPQSIVDAAEPEEMN